MPWLGPGGHMGNPSPCPATTIIHSRRLWNAKKGGCRPGNGQLGNGASPDIKWLPPRVHEGEAQQKSSKKGSGFTDSPLPLGVSAPLTELHGNTQDNVLPNNQERVQLCGLLSEQLLDVETCIYALPSSRNIDELGRRLPSGLRLSTIV